MKNKIGYKVNRERLTDKLSRLDNPESLEGKLIQLILTSADNNINYIPRHDLQDVLEESRPDYTLDKLGDILSELIRDEIIENCSNTIAINQKLPLKTYTGLNIPMYATEDEDVESLRRLRHNIIEDITDVGMAEDLVEYAIRLSDLIQQYQCEAQNRREAML